MITFVNGKEILDEGSFSSLVINNI